MKKVLVFIGIALQSHQVTGMTIPVSRSEFFQSNAEIIAGTIISSSSSSSSSLLPQSSVSSTTVKSIDFPLDDDEIAICRNGAIAKEEAIPGAYQTPCAGLPYRKIPLKSTTTTAIKNGSDTGNKKIKSESKDATSSSTGSSNISIRIAQEPPGPGRTGMTIWNSGIILVRLFESISLRDPNWLSGKTLVELGCGTGFASIAAAKLGAASVVATDGNPEVLKLATNNIQLNQAEEIVKPALLSWGLLDAMDLSDTADIVFGSDLTYFSGTWRDLAETMSTILKENGYVIYVTLGHPGFNASAELDGFLSIARSQKLVLLSEKDDIDSWPLPFTITKFLRESLSSQERSLLDSNGDYRILVLQKRSFRRK